MQTTGHALTTRATAIEWPPDENRASRTIVELAAESGAALRTLRYYEQRGLLRPRRDGAARLYDARDVIVAKFALKARTMGLSIADIAEIVASWEDRHGDGLPELASP